MRKIKKAKGVTLNLPQSYYYSSFFNKKRLVKSGIIARDASKYFNKEESSFLLLFIST